MLPRFAFGLGAMVVLACFTPAEPVRAGDGEYDAALCEAAIVNGARRGGVPAEILHAISLTETGRKTNGTLRPWPWAINREGKGYWFDNREDALAFAKKSLAEGRRSFDVGCVQINYRWHGHAFPTLEDMFNPEWTATYAAQFLRTLYEERQSWSAAAGAYHSLTPELAAKYRKRFDRLLAGLTPGALDGAVAANSLPLPPKPEGLTPRELRLKQFRERRAAEAERQRLAGPPPAPVNGSIAGTVFQPANGSLLNQGSTLLNEGKPLLVAPDGSLY